MDSRGRKCFVGKIDLFCFGFFGFFHLESPCGDRRKILQRHARKSRETSNFFDFFHFFGHRFDFLSNFQFEKFQKTFKTFSDAFAFDDRDLVFEFGYDFFSILDDHKFFSFCFFLALRRFFENQRKFAKFSNFFATFLFFVFDFFRFFSNSLVAFLEYLRSQTPNFETKISLFFCFYSRHRFEFDHLLKKISK